MVLNLVALVNVTRPYSSVQIGSTYFHQGRGIEPWADNVLCSQRGKHFSSYTRMKIPPPPPPPLEKKTCRKLISTGSGNQDQH